MKFALGIAAGKFNSSHTDNKMIDKNRKNCKTPAQLIALYKKAGITHAKEYYALSWSKVGIIILLRRKYPGLQKLSSDELEDRKSTRLNSSHVASSYAVFCLKTKSSNIGIVHV